MNISRMAMVAHRVVTQFRRDRRTLGLVFVAPILIVSLLGLLMRSEAGAIRLALVNEDAGLAGPVVAAALKNNDALQISELSRAAAEQALRSGDVKAIVVLSPALTQSLMSERRLPLQIQIEGSNPVDTGAVMQALSQTAQKAMQTVSSAAGGLAIPRVDIETTYLYGGPQYDMLDLFAPAYISFFIFFLVFLLTCVSFLRERMQGTMERLMATPAGRGEIVLGYALGFGFFALVQSLVILLWSVYVLDIDYAGSLVVVFVIEVVLTLVAVGMGIFLSIFARNELQAVQFIPIVILPQAFLSGFIWNIADMPGWLQPFAYIMPMTYGIRALRDVMVKGLSVVQIAPDLTILVALAAGTLLLAAVSLRREIA